MVIVVGGDGWMVVCQESPKYVLYYNIKEKKKIGNGEEGQYVHFAL